MDDVGSTYIVCIDDAPDHWGLPCYTEHWSLPGEKYAGSERPTYVVRVRKTDQLVRMTYINLEGATDRKDGPADIDFNPDGSILDATYYRNGIEIPSSDIEDDYTPGL